MAAAIPVLFVFMIVVPFCTGLLFTTVLPEDKRTPAVYFTAGFLVQIACFEIIAVCCMLTDVWFPFRRVTVLYTACAILLGALGVFLFKKNNKTEGMLPRIARPAWDKETWVFYGIFSLLVLFQMVMAVYMTSFDGDDTYYVGQSLIAQQTDRMYTIVPYTGISSRLDARHALALITMWQAYLGKMSGIHATVIAHIVMPLFLIPFSYLALYLAGRRLFREDGTRLPFFLILTCLLRIFGNVSIYTPETFLLMRTWQGKSILANLVFVLIIWLFLNLFENPEQPVLWGLLALTGFFAGVCTSIGIFLSAGMTVLFTAALFLYRKNARVLLYGAAALVPNVLYTVLYLVLIRRGA